MKNKLGFSLGCALIIFSPLATANKNPCNVDCVQQLIANAFVDNTAVNAGSGLGIALAGTLTAIARQPEEEASLVAVFKQTASLIIKSTISKEVKDCGYGIGQASAGYSDALARQPDAALVLKNTFALGMTYFSTMCKQKF